MADLKENQLTEIIAAFVRCLDSAGNSGKISIKELQTLMLGGVTNGGISAGSDWNDFSNPGIYSVGINGSTSNGPNSYSYGILVVLKAGSFTFQVFIPHLGTHHPHNKISIRVMSSQSFGEWYHIAAMTTV